MITQHTPWTKFDSADFKEKPSWMKNAVPCPMCKGHRCCIVAENAYGVGKHFKYACSQCGGMIALGWVDANSKDAQCVHNFIGGETVKSITLFTCSKCGAKQSLDSGD